MSNFHSLKLEKFRTVFSEDSSCIQLILKLNKFGAKLLNDIWGTINHMYTCNWRNTYVHVSWNYDKTGPSPLLLYLYWLCPLKGFYPKPNLCLRTGTQVLELGPPDRSATLCLCLCL